MPELIAILMLIISVVITVYPLFRNRAKEPEAVEAIDELLSRRDAIYSAIRELEMDYRMGKLLPEDYRRLRESYQAQAVSILQELDRREREAQESLERALEEEVEREIAARRRAKGKRWLYEAGRSDKS